ncbi:Rap30/74 interaction domain-containing protein [Laetiporus sulphureus 93-53]|uniref:Rap30/74 interaction domain-containing protein n=1 Tax=Laetiporus sulphureus 93-53 TaxID=1314785 RepID=A0A165I8M5_9APHY|nr:Rap30/74 interaction domain-containing protein [Laetiporus sulphureus 93-53]KZT12734.1 Rap30/74 interaction domain-containing protein [Laetiporus sulphureus 93-53]
MALLFHQKKKKPAAAAAPKTESEAGRSPSPGKPSQPARPREPKPQKKEDDDDEMTPLPDGPYSEFRLMSSALNGWKYDIMKFDSRKNIDITKWTTPVRLNRKEPRREVDDSVAAAVPQAVGPMLGPDGKPVIGPDGKMVMVDSEGRPIRSGETQANGGDKGKDKEKAPQKKRFQKKTRQVYLVPEETRQLRKEERYPWVMEDASGKETWIGKMEEVSKAELFAMFMPAANDIFKFVPAHRWYKFQRQPNYRVPMQLEEVEALMAKIQKNKEPERVLRRIYGQNASDATKALFKAEREGSVAPVTASTSLGPGGRRLRTVDSGMAGLFGDDDEDGEERKRKIKRELGAEGDVDEMDFEETFADDEEKMDMEDREDEEARELEERLKKEYKSANKAREGYVDESEEEEETTLTRAGKTLQKTLQKLEKDGGYEESDEEENPYASEVEEEEEEVPVPVQTGPAIIPPSPKPRTPSQGTTSFPTPSATPTHINGTKTPMQVKTESPQLDLSRPTSPIAGHGGHSIVAKRATSPKMPKVPIPGTGMRPTSPLAGRMTSPTSPTSPLANGKPSIKRKATDDGTGGPVGPSGAGSTQGAPKKKRRSHAPPPTTELEDRMVIEWLRDTPGATTRDCIHHFTPWLTDEAKKVRFTALVKEVAHLRLGVLVLRPAYRDAVGPGPGAGGASPTSQAVSPAAS